MLRVLAASKAGVIAFVRSMAPLANENIRINAVAPHYTATKMVSDVISFDEVRREVGGILSGLL